MDVEITQLNGNTTMLSNLGITARDFVVSAIPVEGIYVAIEGVAGTTNLGAAHGQRTITVPIHFKAANMLDFAAKRDNLFALVSGVEPFYVRELRRDVYQSGHNQTVGDRRYLVRLADGFSIEQTMQHGFSELVFETVGLPFGETDRMTFKYASNLFRLVNEGDVPVHPFNQYLKITIKNVVDSTEFLELTNTTNGDVFRVNEAVDPTKTIVLDGPTVTANSLQYLRKTNRKFIRLELGWNDFVLAGATSAEVEFEFKNYYL